MAVTEQQIYQALTQAGYSQVQAAGIMANMQNESSFNVETHAMDTNGQPVYGLISWNQGSYPTASSLVTGNQAVDLSNQIQFLLRDTSGTSQGLVGSTAAQVAGNWAQYVEVCQGCQPGGAQNVQRQANANTIMNEIQSGNWGNGGPGVTGSGSASGTQNAQTTGIITGAGLPFPFDIPGIIGSAFGSGGVTGELTTGIGEGIATGFTSAFTSVTNAFLKKLGINGWSDLFVRLGLILLGAVILIIGLARLTSGTISVPSPHDGSESAEETPDMLSGESSSGNSNGSGETTNRKPTVKNRQQHASTSAPRPGRRKVATGVSSATKKVGTTAIELAAIG